MRKADERSLHELGHTLRFRLLRQPEYLVLPLRVVVDRVEVPPAGGQRHGHRMKPVQDLPVHQRHVLLADVAHEVALAEPFRRGLVAPAAAPVGPMMLLSAVGGGRRPQTECPPNNNARGTCDKHGLEVDKSAVIDRRCVQVGATTVNNIFQLTYAISL